MKSLNFTVFAILALLLIGSEAIRMKTTHTLLTEEQANAKKQAFMRSDADILATLQAQQPLSIFQKDKIYRWMILDEEYSAYLLNNNPPSGNDLFLIALFQFDPKLYLRVVISIANYMHQIGCEGKKNE